MQAFQHHLTLSRVGAGRSDISLCRFCILILLPSHSLPLDPYFICTVYLVCDQHLGLDSVSQKDTSCSLPAQGLRTTDQKRGQASHLLSGEDQTIVCILDSTV